ncbi:restriction endonuclease subunit S [Metamycoplasma hyosynoviae]|nr:restriction endonuclease subunit S [Metamycoplasma hyosynoviae]MDC8937399.1 restriction endonuclease subunit S [Metamycoplasma hyosynoviae]
MANKKLNDICINITDGTHSTVIDDENGSSYLLSCKNIKGGKIFINDNDRKINNNTFLQIRKRTKTEYKDVVITKIGTVGQSACINDLEPNYEFQCNVAILKPNNSIILSEYLNYFFHSNTGKISINTRIKGAAQPCLFLNDLKDIDIFVPDLQKQHHIVNTIGSVDNLIENLTKQNEILMTLGISKINQFNNSYEKKSLNKIVKFEKGFEVGSSKYIEIYKKGLINYLRVGDLLSLRNTYIDEKDSDKIAKFEDILVAFDGSPGRNSIGLVGAYSSGIYNLKSTNKDKGLVYFEMNSDINKKIIDNHSKGTTILHASKSINYLVYVDVDDNDKKVLNNYFYLILQNKKKINFLNKIKDNLLNKYF